MYFDKSIAHVRSRSMWAILLTLFGIVCVPFSFGLDHGLSDWGYDATSRTIYLSNTALEKIPANISLRYPNVTVRYN